MSTGRLPPIHAPAAMTMPSPSLLTCTYLNCGSFASAGKRRAACVKGKVTMKSMLARFNPRKKIWTVSSFTGALPRLSRREMRAAHRPRGHPLLDHRRQHIHQHAHQRDDKQRREGERHLEARGRDRHQVTDAG